MKNAKRFFAVLLSLVMLILSFPFNAFAVETEMTIYSLNCGEGNNGDSTLIKSGNEYLLMDVGVRNSYTEINNALKSLGVTHFSLYISHFHGDHTGGFGSSDSGSSVDETDLGTPTIKNFMDSYVIDNVYLPSPELLKYKGVTVEPNEEVYYRKIKQFYENSSIQNKDYESEVVKYLKCGSSFSLGSVKVDIIGPVGIENFASPYIDGKVNRNLLDTYQNNCSLVARLTCGKTTYLTAGDNKTDGEKALIEKYGSSLKSTIYKMSHHGYYPANGKDFIDCVKPDYSFASNNSEPGLGPDKFWKVHTAQYNCLKYGFVFLSGQENCGLTINVKNDVVSLYRFGSTVKLNAPGWAMVKGGDGTDRQYEYFYFGPDGKTLKGVQKIDNKYYYLGTGGYRHYGSGQGKNYKGLITCTEDGQKRYFAEADGSMYVGFNTVKDDKYNGLYYFDPKTGILKTPTNGKDFEKVKIGNDYYCLYKSGKVSQNIVHQFDGGDNYFGADGKMYTGWHNINGKTYYFDLKNGCRYTGFKKIGSDYYLFSDYGVLTKNAKKTISGKIYYFGKNGAAAKGWATINKKKYYFNPNTAAAEKGLVQIKNNFYWFNESGILCTDKTVKIDGKSYKADSNGKLNIAKLKKTSIEKVKAAKKKFTVTWKKVSGVSGYEIMYSTSSKMSNAKTLTAKKDKTISKEVTKLKSKKTYYVKIRTYKKINGEKFYSAWTKASKVKTK